jgi:starvation-inducible outer membrane lipoprotein
MKIWKYELLMGTTVLSMPKYSRVMHVEKQGETPCMWVEIENQYNEPVEYEERTFVVIGTGWEFGEREIGRYGYHVDTWLDGSYVWHLYERL